MTGNSSKKCSKVGSDPHLKTPPTAKTSEAVEIQHMQRTRDIMVRRVRVEVVFDLVKRRRQLMERVMAMPYAIPAAMFPKSQYCKKDSHFCSVSTIELFRGSHFANRIDGLVGMQSDYIQISSVLSTIS